MSPKASSNAGRNNGRWREKRRGGGEESKGGGVRGVRGEGGRGLGVGLRSLLAFVRMERKECRNNLLVWIGMPARLDCGWRIDGSTRRIHFGKYDQTPGGAAN